VKLALQVFYCPIRCRLWVIQEKDDTSCREKDNNS